MSEVPIHRQTPPAALLALARRVIQCKGWAWKPQMFAINHGIVLYVRTEPGRDDDGYLHFSYGHRFDNYDPKTGVRWEPNRKASAKGPILPDLSDTVTLALLMELVEAAWPDSVGLHLGSENHVPDEDGTPIVRWELRDWREYRLFEAAFASKAECLVDALERVSSGNDGVR